MSSPEAHSRGWRIAFAALLVAGMGSAAHLPIAFGIVASWLRDDLGISRAELGLLISSVLVLSAIASPQMGHLSDRLGGRNALALIFASSGAAFLTAGVAPSYWWMVVPVLVATMAQGFGNPATNKLIATHTPLGRRGVITGIKQSGVQAGAFLSGFILPIIAEQFGWRWALAGLSVVPLAGLLATYPVLPRDRATPPRSSVRPRVMSRPVVVLAVYGGLMGAGAAYTFLIPLFAEEALGLSARTGGFAAGLVGLIALIARIGWARAADRRRAEAGALAALAFLALAAIGVLWASQFVGSWLLWPGVVLTGVSGSSWNAVVMLAVIGYVGPERAGGASGIVMFGFLTGIGVAPALFGWLADITGGYSAMWATCLGSVGVAALLSVWWLRSPHRPEMG